MARAQRIRSGDIQIDGLLELSKALKEMDPALRREMRAASKSVADLVAGDAKSAAFTLGSVAAHVAPSIKASVSATSAGVGFGGPGFEMAGGAEFGAERYPQFQPWRGNSTDAGYFVFPSIRRDADQIETEYTAALDHIVKKAGLA